MLINVIVNRFFVIDAVFVVVRCCLLDLVLCVVFWLFELVCPLFLFLFLFLTLGYCSGGLFFGLVNYDCAVVVLCLPVCFLSSRAPPKTRNVLVAGHRRNLGDHK